MRISYNRSQKLPDPLSNPNSWGTCLMMIVNTNPVTKPARTDSEKKEAMRPSLKRPARMASPAVKAAYSGEPAAASGPTVAADMVAIAAETATTNWRDVPKMAYNNRPIGAA